MIRTNSNEWSVFLVQGYFGLVVIPFPDAVQLPESCVFGDSWAGDIAEARFIALAQKAKGDYCQKYVEGEDQGLVFGCACHVGLGDCVWDDRGSLLGVVFVD